MGLWDKITGKQKDERREQFAQGQVAQQMELDRQNVLPPPPLRPGDVDDSEMRAFKARARKLHCPEPAWGPHDPCWADDAKNQAQLEDLKRRRQATGCFNDSAYCYGFDNVPSLLVADAALYSPPPPPPAAPPAANSLPTAGQVFSATPTVPPPPPVATPTERSGEIDRQAIDPSRENARLNVLRAAAYEAVDRAEAQAAEAVEQREQFKTWGLIGAAALLLLIVVMR